MKKILILVLNVLLFIFLCGCSSPVYTIKEDGKTYNAKSDYLEFMKQKAIEYGYMNKKGEPILWESGYMVKTISPKCHKDFTRQKNWSEATKYKVSYTYSLALATF